MNKLSLIKIMLVAALLSSNAFALFGSKKETPQEAAEAIYQLMKSKESKKLIQTRLADMDNVKKEDYKKVSEQMIAMFDKMFANEANYKNTCEIWKTASQTTPIMSGENEAYFKVGRSKIRLIKMSNNKWGFTL